MRLERSLAACALLVALVAGCAPQPAPEAPLDATTTTAPDPAPAPAATFVNRVWQVVRSPQIASGPLYTFYSDGVLFITSEGNKPLIGAWARTDSGLTMTEESLTYRVDILELAPERFHIRMHNPGEPVEIEFAPAVQQ